MLAALATLLSSFSFFFLLFLANYGKLTLVECAAVAVPTSMVVVSWICILVSMCLNAFFFEFSFDNMGTLLLGLSGLFFAASANLYFFKVKAIFVNSFQNHLLKELKRIKKFAISLVFVSALFAYLVSGHSLEERDSTGNLYSAGSTWGDLPFHLNIISSFLYGSNARLGIGSWKTLIYAGDTLVYPLICDYYSALLIVGGFNFRWSIVLPTFLLLVSLYTLVYSLAERFVESPKSGPHVGIVAILLSIFSGGLAFYSYPADWLLSGRRFLDFFPNYQKNYVHFTNAGEKFWFQTMTDLLLPQRAAVFAYPLLLGSILALWVGLKFEPGNSYDRRAYFRLAAFLAGLIPFCQGHAFLIIGIFSATLALIFLRQPIVQYAVEWLHFVVLVAVLAVPQMLILAQRANRWGFAKYSPVWTDAFKTWSTKQNPLTFWVNTLGLFVPISFVAFFLLKSNQRKFYASSWAVFFIGNLMQFQPWRLDNVKILTGWHFIASIGAALVLERIRARPGLHNKVVFGVLLVTLTASGGLCVFKETQLHWALYTPQDVELAEWTRSHTRPDALFLTGDWHKHPVSSLGGRQLLMGYKGWLWSHGYDYGKRAEDVTRMFSGGPSTADLIKQYAIDYVVIGPRERDQNKANVTYFDQHYTMAFRSASGNDHSAFKVFDTLHRRS